MLAKRYSKGHIFFICLLFLIPIGAVNGQKTKIKSEIKKIIRFDTESQLRDIPGFVVGIYDDGFMHTIPFGTNGKDTLLGDEVFELGSIEKVFVASLVMSMDTKGQLSISAPISEYLPEICPHLGSLTVENLLSHQTPFPRQLPQKQALESRKNFLSELCNLDLREKQKFGYSHLNYTLLKIIVEGLSDRTLSELLQEEIIGPLGMEQTKYGNYHPNITRGFNRLDQLVEKDTVTKHFRDGSLVSTTSDLLHFAMAHLGQSGSTLDTIFPKLVLEKHASSFNKSTFMSLGWFIVKEGKRPEIIMHTGRTDKHQALIALVKKTNTAVILLSNSTRDMENVGLLILRMINDNWKRKS